MQSLFGFPHMLVQDFTLLTCNFLGVAFMPAGWLCCLARPGMARDCCPDNLLLLNQTGCLGNCLQLENQELKTTVSSPRVVLSALRALLNLNLYRCKDAV